MAAPAGAAGQPLCTHRPEEDAPAKAAVGELFDAAGFFPIDLGDLVTGGRMQQMGGPLPAHNLVRLPPVG